MRVKSCYFKSIIFKFYLCVFYFCAAISYAATTTTIVTSGSGSKTVTVVPAPVLHPNIKLDASPVVVASKGNSLLSWSAINATSCTASWLSGAAVGVRGTHVLTALSRDTAYTLTCKNLAVATAAAVTVFVNPPLSSGTTYFVDSRSGNDSYTGMANVFSAPGIGPWRTLGKLTNFSFKPGDTVRLACGSVWNETLKINSSGTVSSPITIMSSPAGCRNLPAIDGSFKIPVNQWVKDHGNVYRTAASNVEPKQLYADNAVLNPAHFPNKGYDAQQPDSLFLHTPVDADKIMRNNRPVSTYIMTGPDLNLPSKAAILPGTLVRVRSNAWTIEDRTVASYVKTRITFDKPLAYNVVAGWGYYLLGQLWMLDSPGEWFYDKPTNTLYVWMLDSLAPHTMVSAGYLPFGIDVSGKNYIMINGIAVRYAGEGINMRKTTGVTVRNNVIQDTFAKGINASASQLGVIEGNLIERTALEAVSGVSDGYANGLRVASNKINYSGVLMNGEVVLSLPQKTVGAIVPGPNAVVTANSIMNTGYIGIFLNSNSIADGNYIYGVCMVLDDCGGIYTSSSPNGSSILNNILVGSRGGLAGKPYGAHTQAQGIYLDELASGITVKGNTVTGADSGIQLHIAALNRIENNVFFGNRNNQIWLQETDNRTRTAGDLYGNVIVGNDIVPNIPGATGFSQGTKFLLTDDFAQYDQNHYFDLLNQNIGQESGAGWALKYTFAQWRSAKKKNGTPRSQDTHGRNTANNGFAIYAVTGQSIVPNGSFKTNMQGWSSWNQTAPLGTRVREVCGGGFCLHYKAGATEGLVASPNFAVVKDQWYRVSFDLRTGVADQAVSVMVRGSGGGTNGYESLGGQIALHGTAPMKRYSFYFKALKTINVKDPVTKDNGARMDFYGVQPGQTISIGNIEMVPITSVDTGSRSDLLLNPSSAAIQLPCPVSATAPALCTRYVRFSDKSVVKWPYTLAAHSTAVIFTRDGIMVDSDGDGIPDTQDKCPNSVQGLDVNAQGCGL